LVLSGFEWDDGNADHIARHGLSPDEVEEAFAGTLKIRKTRDGRYLAFGETLDGRLVLAVFEKLAEGRVRVVTARDMDDAERRLYRRK
jgi:uncharacterized DUF497 family protein